MYTVSFYSFKGGVGRTMALANVGARLAQTGRKVLMVDFDLEAPGLGTYDFPKPKDESRGVVEFVIEYLASNRAPRVKDYVYRSPGSGKEGGDLWIMPAGIQDLDYASKFAQIDWADLYENRKGFLLMEDLKKQWEKELEVDYVLIDSRTGHSDVVGICTRQLPDAVVLMMYPNAQNLVGLRKVVSDIRAQDESPGSSETQLHFVISNVPDLDDENQILANTFEQFSEQLGYDDPCVIIHRYQSLALLNQDVFSVTRPRTRLAQEYYTLIDEIIKYNDEDKEGALVFLESTLMDMRYRDSRRQTSEIGAEELQRRVNHIEEEHSDDPEILYALAQVSHGKGQFEQALDLYKHAREKGSHSAGLLISTARLYDMLDDKAAAGEAIREVLQIEDVSHFDLSFAARLLSKVAPDDLGSIANCPALLSMEHSDQIQVATRLSDIKGGYEVSEEIILRVREESGKPDIKEAASNKLAIGQIGRHRFEDAIDELISNTPDETEVENNKGRFNVTANVFNLGMAKWGQNGEPNAEMFQRVVDLEDVQSKDFNYTQCLAIAHYVVGNIEEAKRRLVKAKGLLLRHPRRQFSAWSFEEETPKQLKEHLAEMQDMISGKDVLPKVVIKGPMQYELH